MKHILLCGLLAVTSAGAVIPGLPTDEDQCRFIGSIAGVVATQFDEGKTKTEAAGVVKTTIRRAMNSSVSMPPWLDRAIDVAWTSRAGVPDISPESAKRAMIKACRP